MRYAVLSYFLFLISHSLFAQHFGGNPTSHTWKQINTDSARIIFPAGLDSQANRVASIVHYLAANNPASLGSQVKKINIVLQNQTIIPNGYVQLGPYRSEFFMTPDMNSFSQGTIPWSDQLALHEYRHVQQFNNFNNGLSHVMKTLFGQEGYALAINASIPDWFYEGDAVYNETVLTKQGRGRLPLFLNAFPSLWREGKNYSWMKLRNGSYKDYVPNHYYLGYLLVNYGRERYGADFWTKVTKDASAYNGLFYPFQKAVKKYAGVDYKKFREQAFSFYKTKTDNIVSPKDEYLFPVKKEHVVSYYFPYAAGNDSLIYLKTSFHKRPAFYIKDVNGEHKLRVKDIAIDEQYSYRNGKIVYAALENDPRWLWKDYSVIKLLDVQTGKQRKLTSKTKYFTPDISADGSKVAAVQVSESGQSELHILDAANGQVLKAIKSTEVNLFTDPKFIDENSLVTAVRLNDGKMALASAEISTGNTMRLTPPSFNVVGYPCVSKGIIYFTASYDGNDDVFALRMSDSKIFKISNGPSGKYFVNAGNGKITWSEFTAEGYQLMQVDEQSIAWNEISAATAEKLEDKFPVSGDKEWSAILRAIPQRNFTTAKYRKGTKLFNFHSWRPYYEDPIFTFSLYGENVLNTFQTELYYLYNQDEKTSAVGFGGVYSGWFPYINFGTELTFNRERITGNKLRQWDQLDSRIGLSIPLSMTSGQTYRNFNISSFYVLRNEFNKGFFKDSTGNTSFTYLQHSISWNQQVQRAVQHFYPRFAYFLSATYRHAITSYEGYQFNSTANLFIPGFMPAHNIQLAGFFQQIDTLRQVLFGNRFPYSRGYTGRYYSRMWRLSANYHLPLVYPDWGFGNILYLQRLRGNIFYDFTNVSDRKASADQRSVGAEIFVDTKWWNQYPLTFGFRVSRLLDRDQFDGFKGTIFEFILPVSILPR
ncbi:MAG TPA: hypothetical protein VGO58_05640 [Chitinophagaceae bacterium]|jgi:hypothetical protein|nr:hypothetical protein [Chitinophagaceae bacterium]